MNATKTSLSLALAAALGVAGMAHAAGNPFAMQNLDQGYLVAAADDKAKEGKCGEGKCGGMKGAKTKEGKCGDMKDAKAKEGKCGDMKDAKAKEGKCGEGKCGGKK